MKLILAIAAGGALGAVGRHLVAAQVGHWLGSGFPFGTIAVNVAGSFVLGVLVELFALVWSPSLELRAFLTVGAMGAFTTFSTFSMDAVLLYERGAHAQVAAYIGASVVFSILAFFLGLRLCRALVM